VVTNGPYLLSKWEFKVRLVLEKSPTYWDRDHVLTDRMEMLVNENPLSQFLQYEAKEADWISDVINRDQAAEMRAQGRTDLRSSAAFGTAFLSMLCQEKLPPSISKSGEKNPLADVRVRQALAMSADRSFITTYITRMGELPARTYLPPDGTLPDFRWMAGPFDPAGPDREPYKDTDLRKLLPDTKGIAGPGLPYNIEQAKKLLAEAGYPNGTGFPSLPILYNSDNPLRGKIALALKDQWKQALNIDVTPQQIDGKIFQQQITKKDFAMALQAWYGDYPDASTFTDKYLSTSLQNEADWRNSRFDDLCEQARHEGDPQERIRLLSKAENLIDTEVPIIPLYHYVNLSMSRDNVEGVEPNPRNLTIFKGVRVK
jgi:oligopeptide transport system substrate-binding protein